METQNSSLVYPKEKFHVILQSAHSRNEFFGLDELERKKLKIIQAKYRCHYDFFTLPDQVSLNANKFYWNASKDCFIIDQKHKIRVQLNKLEEAITQEIREDYFQYLFW